jgi:hypothetical protein
MLFVTVLVVVVVVDFDCRPFGDDDEAQLVEFNLKSNVNVDFSFFSSTMKPISFEVNLRRKQKLLDRIFLAVQRIHEKRRVRFHSFLNSITVISKC